jgi:hypothetical protein
VPLPETHTAYVIAAFDAERRGSTIDLRLRDRDEIS